MAEENPQKIQKNKNLAPLHWIWLIWFLGFHLAPNYNCISNIYKSCAKVKTFSANITPNPSFFCINSSWPIQPNWSCKKIWDWGQSFLKKSLIVDSSTSTCFLVFKTFGTLMSVSCACQSKLWEISLWSAVSFWHRIVMVLVTFYVCAIASIEVVCKHDVSDTLQLENCLDRNPIYFVKKNCRHNNCNFSVKIPQIVIWVIDFFLSKFLTVPSAIHLLHKYCLCARYRVIYTITGC